MERDAIILGAGPAGLSVAAAMARRGKSAVLIDPACRAGGAVRTVREDGWQVELGPSTLQLETEEDARWIGELGLGEALVDADAQGARRLIAHGGVLHALTASPTSLLRSGLLSTRGKLRLLAEILRPRGGFEGETVRAFAERRFGAEVAERLVDPAVSGIYAGDPGRLVLAHAFPTLARAEREHRSVILGLRREPGLRRRVVQFEGGLSRLTEALVAQLPPDALQLGSTPTLAHRDARGWNVAWRGTDGAEAGARARHLVITAPPWQWPGLPLGETLREVLPLAELVEAPPVALVVRGYDRARVRHPLDAFGLLLPRSERRRVLGVLFSSSTFPRFTPAGKVQVACFVGGAREQALGRLDDAELRRLVDAELGELIGAEGPPEREWIARWPRAIPQCAQAHSRFLESLDAAERAHPGLRFAGCYRGGVSLMSTLRRGSALGAELAGA